MADERPEDREEGPGGFELPPSFFPYGEPDATAERPESYGEPVEVKIEGVFVHREGDDLQHFVLLTDGYRRLPIIIGIPESNAIAIPLDGLKPDRPGSHDLMVALIERLGAEVEKIVIDDLWGSTYYAKIHLVHEGKTLLVDSRPSDAVALAVRVSAPIFVADAILGPVGT
jgi:bifunctional DNase/RNase